ncbi:MAG: type I glutamate--ammonia ligase [Candidatus Eisenbacteria bacterium]|nr:type I glutamate--ammonia ligase [Candidatus Eisenbacteria bacterium]
MPDRIAAHSQSVQNLLRFATDQKIETVDLKFVDLSGRWHHLTLPHDRLGQDLFSEGIPFDGSSVAGYRPKASSDMTLIPDPDSGVLDPFWDRPTLSLICDIFKGDGTPFPRDPRGIARRAEAYLKKTGIADRALMSPEFEFYVFDDVRHRSDVYTSYYRLDSREAEWNSHRPSGHGTTLPLKGGYHALPPQDRLYLLRDEMVRHFQACGIPVRYHHHEGGGPGQSEIEILFLSLLAAGDATMLGKYLIRMCADRNGRTATFMPKPLWNAAGSGMHIHQHLFLEGRPLFYDESGWAGLSELALHYVGGLLRHGPALLGLTNPSTNSYRRLVPGFEAPIHAIYGLANRSAAVRIPEGARTPDTKRIEFRPPDGTCNIYLALAGMLMAGLDGIVHRVDPHAEGFGPYDQNISDRPDRDSMGSRTLPLSLVEALDALERDHLFLLEGGVFDEETIATWIEIKRKEALDVRNRPHPREIALYFDA